MAVMGKPRSEPPNTWDTWKEMSIRDAGSEIYYAIVGEGIVQGESADNVWVWHWHTPTEGAERWALSSCGLHTVKEVEPLTLSPSLACENGCPSHGYIVDGIWRPV